MSRSSTPLSLFRRVTTNGSRVALVRFYVIDQLRKQKIVTTPLVPYAPVLVTLMYEKDTVNLSANLLSRKIKEENILVHWVGLLTGAKIESDFEWV